MTRIFVLHSTKFRNEISSYAMKSRVGSPSRLRNFADIRTIDASKFRRFFVWKESSQFVSANFSTINSLSFLLHSTTIIRKRYYQAIKERSYENSQSCSFIQGFYFFFCNIFVLDCGIIRFAGMNVHCPSSPPADMRIPLRTRQSSGTRTVSLVGNHRYSLIALWHFLVGPA